MGTRLAAAAVRWAVDEAQQKFTASKWSQLISLTSIYAPSAAQGSLRGLARTAAGGLVDCRSAAWHSRAIASSVSDLAEERANRNRPNSRGNWDDGRPSSPHPQQQDRRRSWGDARPSGSRPQPQDRQQQNRPWQDRQHQDRPRTWGEGKPSFQRAQQPQQDRQQGQRPWQERQQDGHRPWVRPNSNPNGPRQQSDYRSRPHVNGQRPEYDRPQNFGNRNTSATGPGRDQRSSGWSPKYNGRQQQAGQRHNGDARKPFTYNGRNTKFGKSGAKGAVKAPAASDSVTVPVDVTVVRLAQILGKKGGGIRTRQICMCVCDDVLF